MSSKVIDEGLLTFNSMLLSINSVNTDSLSMYNCITAMQVARCVCRRAERRVNELTSQEPTDPNCRIFLNRLSDYLFTAARVASYIEGGKELIYK